MRLARSTDPRSTEASLFPYPIRTKDAASGSASLPAAETSADNSAKNKASQPSPRALADLIDLVANHRSDLLKTFLDVLDEAGSARQATEELTDLVAASGVPESHSPCATALAIAADLDRLAAAPDEWTHPAQIIRRPHVQALSKLCAAKVQRCTGSDRLRFEEILPRLERAAKLTERAASRRQQEAERHSLR